MKKVKLLLLFLMMFSTMSIFSQRKTTVINDFMKSVFVENKSAQFIADHYIYFQSVSDSRITPAERMNFFEKLLSDFKTENSARFDSSNFQIVNYNEFKGDKVEFVHQNVDSYIVVSKNIPLAYIYLKENKIMSFSYMLKGREAIFIGY